MPVAQTSAEFPFLSVGYLIVLHDFCWLCAVNFVQHNELHICCFRKSSFLLTSAQLRLKKKKKKPTKWRNTALPDLKTTSCSWTWAVTVRTVSLWRFGRSSQWYRTIQNCSLTLVLSSTHNIYLRNTQCLGIHVLSLWALCILMCDPKGWWATMLSPYFSKKSTVTQKISKN